MNIWVSMVCTGLLLALTGCGGGGGGSSNDAAPMGPITPPDEPQPQPEKPTLQSISPAGIWHGTGLDERTLTALVLGSGEYVMIYSATGDASVSGGLVQGSITLSGSPFFAPDSIDLNFEGAGSNATDLTATGEFQTSLNGSLVADADRSATKEFALTFSPLSLQAPSLERVAGVYNGELAGLVGAEQYELTIDEDGAVTASASSGCLATGTVRPQVMTNIYDVEIVFGAAPCFRPGKVVSGLGAFDPDTNLLLIGLVDTARNRGLVFSGNRQGGVDFDGDGMVDGEDADDDNDCVADTDDQCPLDTNLGCPDTVLVGNQEWLQPSLFKNLTWNDIDAACPADSGGACSGRLAGRDMVGWTWASKIELRALFAEYEFVIMPPGVGIEEVGPIEFTASQQATAEWHASGWQPIDTQCSFSYCNYFYTGYTSDPSDTGNDADHKQALAAVVLTSYPLPFSPTIQIHGFVLMSEHSLVAAMEHQGAWFYRSPPIDSNCPSLPTVPVSP